MSSSGITLEQAQRQLDIWLTADAEVASAQSYKIPNIGREVTKADAAEITEKIKYWNNQVRKLKSGGITFIGGAYS